jgi:hypothetical protein
VKSYKQLSDEDLQEVLELVRSNAKPGKPLCEIFSDEELGELIEGLAMRSASQNGTDGELLGFAASDEWRRRFPGVLPPHIARRAAAGTLPKCFRLR